MRIGKAALQGPVMLGHSPGISTVRTAIAMAARTDAKVLVLGETGVGKDVVARLIHTQSARATRPFVAVNCSGIPESLLESELFGHVQGSFTGAYRNKRGLVRQAERGTLFLDELGEMSLRMQAVLLRFTETGEIQPIGAETPAGRADVRLIAATNRDLRMGIASGTFREDLYYRLNVITIHVPPLRDRGDDVVLLLEHFLERAAQEHGLQPLTVTPDAALLLVAYAWPGNIRELRNVTERLVAHGSHGPVTPDDLPSDIRESRAVVRAQPPALATPPAQARSRPEANADRVQQLWNRLQAGEDFWTVVHNAFKARELARADLAALIDRGLTETCGSYRALVTLFHLPPADYKRFHAFLYQQRCNLPVAPYRSIRVDGTSRPAAKDRRASKERSR